MTNEEINKILELVTKLIKEKLHTEVYDSGYYQQSAIIIGEEELLKELKEELIKL